MLSVYLYFVFVNCIFILLILLFSSLRLFTYRVHMVCWCCLSLYRHHIPLNPCRRYSNAVDYLDNYSGTDNGYNCVPSERYCGEIYLPIDWRVDYFNHVKSVILRSRDDDSPLKNHVLPVVCKKMRSIPTLGYIVFFFLSFSNLEYGILPLNFV